MKTIFARYGDKAEIENSGADWEVDDIYEIVNIINELNSA
jgi:putative hydrolase of the HAD superfamily